MKSGTPDACIRTFADCIARGDLEGAALLFEEAASLVEDDGTILRGRAEIRDALAPYLQAEGARSYEVRRLIRIGGDLAVVYNSWRANLSDHARAEVPHAGAGLQLLRRSADGAWRIVFDEPHTALDDA